MAIIITNATELAAITSGNDYILGNDINVPYAWTAIPNTDHITLDGDGHTIESLYNSLFNNLNESTIKNLNIRWLYAPLISDGGDLYIDNINIEGGSVSGSGALSQVLWRSEVENVVNRASVSNVSMGGYYVGGLVGVADSTIFTNCINYGDVSGKEGIQSPAGGIAGHYQTTMNFEDVPADYGFFNCKNYGKITSFEFGGGIVGFVINDKRQYQNYPIATFRIINCQNYGSVGPATAAMTYQNGDHHYGGILGIGYMLVDEVGNCLNTGEISGGGCVGGIAGEMSNTYTYEDQNINWFEINRIINCVNKGSVTLTVPNPLIPPNQDWARYKYAGGIVGAMRYGGGVIDCINEGAVTSDSDDTGGIAGYVLTGTVSGNENTAEVQGTINVGGIVGEISRFVPDNEHIISAADNVAIVDDNLNTGLTFGTRSNVGGIVGLMDNGAQTINNRACGAVQSERNCAGGIVGYAQETDYPGEEVISGNVAGNPYVRAVTGVARILGCEGTGVDLTLNNDMVSGDILLTGLSSGGLTYNNQTVSLNDTELGVSLKQGATAVCAPGYHFAGCQGCVPDGGNPTIPKPPQCCCRCRPVICTFRRC